MKRRYRLLYMIVGVVILLSAVFFEKNIGLASLVEEVFINGCVNMTMPGAICYTNPQKLLRSTVFDELMKTTVPVSAMLPGNNDDYIMLADNACGDGKIYGTNDKTDNTMHSGGQNDNGDNNSENNSSDNGGKAKEASGKNGVQNENKDGTIAKSTAGTDMNNETADIIQRKEITGTVYNKAELSDYGFVHNHFYTITSITELTESILRPDDFINRNLAIDKGSGQPQILIFHTHSQEGFTDSVEGDAATSIVGVGDYLTKLLTEKYGYNVIHDTTVYDYVDGKLDRSKAYTYAENGIAQILNDNPSIEVVIDLHRDGVADTTHLVTNMDGKSMAKIMFFNGLSYSKINGDITYLNNPYRDDNLAMSLQMQLIGEAYYPGFLRRIYVNAYRYCLHERGRSMLIEAGAQTNTFEEVKNAMEPLADILDKCLSGEKVMNDT